MNATTNSNVSYPVVTSSSGNARLAAYQAGQANNEKLTQLSAVGGGGNIPAPSVPISYKENGTGSNVSSTITEIANIQAQSGANRVYDSPANVKSGGRRHKKLKTRKRTYKKRKGSFKRKTSHASFFRRKRRTKTKK
jgi:hypothetical protein